MGPACRSGDRCCRKTDIERSRKGQRMPRGMILPRCTRWPFQLCPFRRLSVGCSRRSAVDTGRSTSVDRTPFSDPDRSPPATPCDAASDDDDRTTRSDCRDLLGRHRSSEQYDGHRTTPTVFPHPGNAHPPSRTARARRCGNRRRSRFLTAVERNTILIQQNSRDRAIAGQHPCGVDADRAHPIRPRETQFLSRRQ